MVTLQLENAPTYDYAISKFNDMHLPEAEQKQVLLHSYSQISELEKAINAIQQYGIAKIMVSVLGNFGEDYSDNSTGLVNKNKYLQSFFKQLLGKDVGFDSFYNSETGRVFVTGFLVPTFIHQVGEKKLGALSGGPYGVLRGLGVSAAKAASSVKKLNGGRYLLVVRGDRLKIESLEGMLDALEKTS